MNQSKKIQDNLLLPISHLGLPYFRHSDTEVLFQENLKKKPKDWLWRNKKIRYTVNSEGYRAPEWSQVDWNNSIVVMGCSHVFGIGVDDDETLPKHLQQTVSDPVINLGFPAGSATNILYNTVRLLEKNFKPKTVICLFPSTSRDVYFYDNEVKNLGAWSTEVGYYTQTEVNYITSILSEESNILNRNYIYESAIEMLWTSNNVKFRGLVHTRDLRIKQWPELSKPIDSARDDKHYGPETFKLWTKEIINDLN